MRVEKVEPAIIPLRIITHNIRFSNPRKRKPNEKPWSIRSDLIGKQLRFFTRFLPTIVGNDGSIGGGSKIFPGASLVCLQEVLHDQLIDVLASLNGSNQHQNNNSSTNSATVRSSAAWTYIGSGRDDGLTRGEYSPIFYRPRELRLIHSEMKWLSLTPDEVGSRYPDAGDVRIVTVGVFEHRASGTKFIAMNGHLDNVSRKARVHSIKVILETLANIKKAWMESGSASILAGDFNSFVQSEDDAYETLAASGELSDIAVSASCDDVYGEINTFTGFRESAHEHVKPEPSGSDQGRIDFIWLGPKDQVESMDKQKESSMSSLWRVHGYAVLPNIFLDDPIYCSDHRPVIGDVILSTVQVEENIQRK